MARLAQSVEHETLNLRVVGSSPTLGAVFKRLLIQLLRRNTEHIVQMADESDHGDKRPRRDLNSRPLVYKTSALTTELRSHVSKGRKTDLKRVVKMTSRKILCLP